MSKPKKESRSYDGSRRRKQADDTRERILEAARELFAQRGYAETTIDAIAVAAHVAAPTVYASFKSKRGVLSALMLRLASGEKGGPPLLQTAGPRAVLAETDPRRALLLFVEHLSQVQERIIPTYEALKSAARSEPDMAELLTRMQDYRLSNITTLPAKLAELRALRPELSKAGASRTIWVLASPEVRQMLQSFAGWSADRYRTWLLETLTAVLLTPGAASSARGRKQR